MQGLRVGQASARRPGVDLRTGTRQGEARPPWTFYNILTAARFDSGVILNVQT